MWLDLHEPSQIAQELKSNLLLNIKPNLALPSNTKHMAIDGQVCFHRWHFVKKPFIYSQSQFFFKYLDIHVMSMYVTSTFITEMFYLVTYVQLF